MREKCLGNRGITRKIFGALGAIFLVLVLGCGVAVANEIAPTGLGEVHYYKIQIYADTGYYTKDVARALTAHGTITANLTSTSGVNIITFDAAGNQLTYPVTCYKGSKVVFTNTFGGQVRTQPAAKALNKAHSLGGQWVYRNL